jgi:hypothetical protein
MTVINNTPFPEFFFNWVKPDKSLGMTAVVKADFSIDLETMLLTPCVSQAGPGLVDSYYGDPKSSSLRLEHDRIPYKPRGEIYFVDPIARPSNNQPTNEWICSVSVDFSLHFSFFVSGPRVYEKIHYEWVMTCSKATSEVPVRFEYMFGGSCPEDPTDQFAQNPVGCGATLKSGKRAEGDRGHQIGHHNSLLADTPPALTPIHRAWSPRRELAGVLDDEWLQTRWPLFPDSFSPDFYQQSPKHLQLPSGFFSGDELVEIKGLGIHSEYRFQLPEERQLFLIILSGESTSRCEFVIDTIKFYLEESKLSIIWRVVVPSHSPDSVFYIEFEE